jgi:hypothetical protein
MSHFNNHQKQLTMTYTFAMLATGEILLADNDGKATAIQSRFIADAERRDSKTQSLNAWKGDTQAWGQGWMAPEWSSIGPSGAREIKKMAFTNIASDRGNLAYSIGMPGGGGLFRFDVNSKSEQRLMHRNAFFPSGLSSRSSDGLLVFSVAEPSGLSSIVIGQRDGVQHVRLTAGDSRDESPTWANIDGRDYIYFHSFGIGRNQQGLAIGYSSSSICRIPVDGGDVEVIAQDDQFDYLQPRLTSDGQIYCIRRPYKATHAKPVTFVELAKDVVFFPFRLARAAYYFANFISLMFSGRTLADSHRDPTQQPVSREMVLWGRALQAQKTLKESGGDGRKSLAPKDWELVRVTSSGKPEVVIGGVICFDISQSGRVIYSDGSGVYEWANSEKLLCSQKGVTQLAALE